MHPTLRGDALRGDRLGVVDVYVTGLPPFVRSSQTLFARSSGLLGAFVCGFRSPRWTALMALRSSESGDFFGRGASSDAYPLGARANLSLE